MESTPLLVDKDPAAKLDSAACGTPYKLHTTTSDLKNRIQGKKWGLINRNCKVIRKDKFWWTGKL